jgi:hypothetical protein
MLDILGIILWEHGGYTVSIVRWGSTCENPTCKNNLLESVFDVEQTLWSKPKTWLSWGHRLEWWFSMSNRQMYTQVWPFDPLPFINTLPLWLPPVRVSNGSNQLLSARARNPQTVSQHSTLYPMRCISSGWMRNPSVEPEIWWWNHFLKAKPPFSKITS